MYQTNHDSIHRIADYSQLCHCEGPRTLLRDSNMKTSYVVIISKHIIRLKHNAQ